MKTKILTAIAMLLTIVSVAGCASSKPMPDAAQLQTPASTAELPLLQELHEGEAESKTADSRTETKPEVTAEKEMTTSMLPTEPVQTEPAPESAPTAMPETSVESAPIQPTEVSSQPTEPAKPTVPEPEPTAPPQPTESPKPTEPAPTEPSPTEPTPTVPIPTEPQPTEPEGCTHDWQCIHHDEEGHWLAGIICDCGWTVYGSPDEVSAAWNAHSASFPPEESLIEHGGYGCVDEWVVDTPAYEEWCTFTAEMWSRTMKKQWSTFTLPLTMELEYEPPITESRLYVVEKFFKNKAEAMADRINFIQNPDPQFGSVLDDLFGDG